MTSAFTMASALQVPAFLVAEWLPDIETAAMAALTRQRTNDE